VGHLLDGPLANAAEANPQALAAAEANPQALADAATTVLNNLSGAGTIAQAAAVDAALHGDLSALTAPPAPPADTTIHTSPTPPPPVGVAAGQHDADDATPLVPHVPSAAEIDHLTDTVSHAVGGPAGAVIDAVGHLLDGTLASAAESHPQALAAAEANPEAL